MIVKPIIAQQMEDKWNCVINDNVATLTHSWYKNISFTLRCDKDNNITYICSQNIKFPDDKTLVQHIDWICKASNNEYTDAIEILGASAAWSLLGNAALHGRTREDIMSLKLGGNIPEPFSWLPDNCSICQTVDIE